MSPEVLYRKWRPQTLAEVVGQEAVTTTLLNAVRTDRVGHAYLFCGPRGTGKTSTGRILAKAVNCLDSREGEPCNVCEACVSITEGRCLDVIEIDAASNRGVDDIRQLRERVNFAAGSVRRKVYIVDEVHMLTDVASNALLKTLEEPPPHVMFILATTEFHKVLSTIVSRCQSFHFRRLTLPAIVDKLGMVCEREGVEADAESLAAISRVAGGSLRDAENLLQQLMSSHGRRLSSEDVRAELGIGDEAQVMRLLAALGSHDLSAGLRVLHDMSDEGGDIRNFGRQVVATLRDVMLVQSGCGDIVEADSGRLAQLQPVAQSMSLADVARSARRFAEAGGRDASQPLLALELAYVDCVVGLKDGGDRAASQREVGEPAEGAAQGRNPPARSRTRERPAAPHGGQPLSSPPPARGTRVTEAVEAVAPTPMMTDMEPASGPLSATPDTSPELRVEPTGVPEEALQGDLGRVRARWKEYVDSLRGLGSTGNLDAFLRSACEPVSLENDVLVLKFAHEFHKRKVEDPKYCHVVEQRLQEFFDRPFKVSCVLDSAEGSAPVPPPPAPVRREGMVDAAVRMGARLKKQE